jgi:predicted permease
MRPILRVYWWLARAFPHEFRLAYGTEMERLGEDLVADLARRWGLSGLFRLLLDLATRLPVEYLSEMRHDMLIGWRGLVRSPGFAFVGIASMGLGMGLTTVVYTSKWTVLTRELPAANARRLAIPEKAVSYHDVEQFREEKRLFEGVAAFETGIPFNVTVPGVGRPIPHRVFGQLVSPDYFAVLGVSAERGRVLHPALDTAGGETGIVVTDRFWRNDLRSSPNVVGTRLRLNGQPATIVGVASRDFRGVFPLFPADVFVPITAPPELAPELGRDALHRRDARQFQALICLAPGVTLGAAEATLDVLARRLEGEEGGPSRASDTSRRVTLLAGGMMVPVPRRLRPLLLGFFAVLMALVMALAIVNLANMLIARGVHRRKEVAIRLALGASRFRLVRQFVSEGIVLSLLGGLAGFGFAYALSIARAHFAPPSAVPMDTDRMPDAHVALFVVALAALSGIAFSVIPALRGTRGDMTPALKPGAVLHLPGFRRLALRNVLMVCQVAGSLMLLLITGFLVVGLTTVSRLPAGSESLYLFSLDPVRDGYTPEKARAFFEGLPERLGATGGVRGVALAAQPPFTAEEEDDGVHLQTVDPDGASRVEASAFEESVGAGFFAVLSQPVLAGREFLPRDLAAGGTGLVPAVLNETAARRFFGNAPPVGSRLRDDRETYEVVGVVRDLNRGMGPTQAVLYRPLGSRNLTEPPPDGITVMVRGDRGGEALAAIRRDLTTSAPDLSLFNVRTLGDYLDRIRSSERLALNTYGGIGLFGLVLAAIGLAGVTAYAVAQRRREIGIRMALGARRGQILLLVLREGSALIGIGTLLGLLGAFAVARALAGLTSTFADSLNVGTGDLRLLFGAPAILAGLAMLACLVPARKAASVDPLQALRQD